MSGRRLGQLAIIPVAELKGVGEKKAEGLEIMGIRTVLDLITHYPRRWVDRSSEARIADLLPDDTGTTRTRLLDTAAADGSLVLAYHLAGTGHVERDGEGYRLV